MRKGKFATLRLDAVYLIRYTAQSQVDVVTFIQLQNYFAFKNVTEKTLMWKFQPKPR